MLIDIATENPEAFFSTVPPILCSDNYFTVPIVHLPDEIVAALGGGSVLADSSRKRSTSLLIHRDSLTYFGMVSYLVYGVHEGVIPETTGDLHVTTFFWSRHPRVHRGPTGYQIIDVVACSLDGPNSIDDLVERYVAVADLPPPDPEHTSMSVSLPSTCVHCKQPVERIVISIGPPDDPTPALHRRHSFHIDLHGDPRFPRPDGHTPLHPIHCYNPDPGKIEERIPKRRRKPGAPVGTCQMCRQVLLWSVNTQFPLHADTGSVYCIANPEDPYSLHRREGMTPF